MGRQTSPGYQYQFKLDIFKYILCGLFLVLHHRKPMLLVSQLPTIEMSSILRWEGKIFRTNFQMKIPMLIMSHWFSFSYTVTILFSLTRMSPEFSSYYVFLNTIHKSLLLFFFLQLMRQCVHIIHSFKDVEIQCVLDKFLFGLC